jgi:hypothetical protein
MTAWGNAPGPNWRVELCETGASRSSALQIDCEQERDYISEGDERAPFALSGKASDIDAL